MRGPTTPANPSRRRLLRRGLLGGLLLAVGGVGAVALRRPRLWPLPPEGLRALTPEQYAVVMAVAARLVLPQKGFPSVEEAGVGVSVDRLLVRASDDVRRELGQLLVLFDSALAGLVLDGRRRPFTALSAGEQDQALAAWSDSRLTLRRSGYWALRSLVLGAYYSSPLAWPALGYAGPPAGFGNGQPPPWKGRGAPRPDGLGAFRPPDGGAP